MNQQQYDMLCARRQAFDGLVWQVPSLAIAAQAFLLSTSLDVDTGPANAVVLAICSALIGTASAQLMAKHRQLEIEDSERLRQFELANAADGFEVLHGKLEPPAGMKRHWLVRKSSYRIWQYVLIGFVLLALYAMVSALI